MAKNSEALTTASPPHQVLDMLFKMLCWLFWHVHRCREPLLGI